MGGKITRSFIQTQKLYTLYIYSIALTVEKFPAAPINPSFPFLIIYFIIIHMTFLIQLIQKSTCSLHIKYIQTGS